VKFIMKIQYRSPEDEDPWGLVYLNFIGEKSEVHRYDRFFYRMLNDIAHEKEDCLDMLETIAKIEKGEIEEYEVDGNAFSSLRVNKDYAQVDIDGDDEWVDRPDSKFRFEEFKTAVQALIRFHELPYDRYNTLEVELFEGKAFRYFE
jgi:predicted DNA-binding ribbon-helix-helix protein